MRCDEFMREWQLAEAYGELEFIFDGVVESAVIGWQLAEAYGELELSAAAAAHLAACPMCQAVALAPPGLDTALREALAARALRATPRPVAIAIAREAAIAALPPRPAPPAPVTSQRRATGRSEPLRFVALPPTLAGWAVAAVLLIMVGLLGRAPLGRDEALYAAQTATAIAALPSATPSPTVSLAAPPTAVSMARPAATPAAVIR